MNPRTDLRFADDFIVDAIEAARAREEAARVRTAEERRIKAMTRAVPAAAPSPPPIIHRVEPRPEAPPKRRRAPTRDPNALTPSEQAMFELVKRQSWANHSVLGAAYADARKRPEFSLASINVVLTTLRAKVRRTGWIVPYRTNSGVQPQAHPIEAAETQ